MYELSTLGGGHRGFPTFLFTPKISRKTTYTYTVIWKFLAKNGLFIPQNRIFFRPYPPPKVESPSFFKRDFFVSFFIFGLQKFSDYYPLGHFDFPGTFF